MQKNARIFVIGENSSLYKPKWHILVLYQQLITCTEYYLFTV